MSPRQLLTEDQAKRPYPPSDPRAPDHQQWRRWMLARRHDAATALLVIDLEMCQEEISLAMLRYAQRRTEVGDGFRVVSAEETRESIT